MHTISIDASPAQLRKLRKGIKVRVKKGTGFNIIVHPETYNRVTRAFAKKKGLELALTQEELHHNQNYEEEEDDEGNYMRGLFSEGASMVPSPSEPAKMQELQQPISRGTEGQGLFRKVKRTVKDNVHNAKLADELNHHLQKNYDYMGRAGIDNAIKMAKQAGMSKMGINARKALAPYLDGNDSDDNEIPPRSRMYIKGGSISENGTVGLNGGMMHTYVPPALISQPFSANFQMQHFLPPQYQHFEQGGHDDSEANGLGSGLYAGRGLGLGISGGKINRLQKAQMWTGYAGDAGRQGFDLAKYGQDTFKGRGLGPGMCGGKINRLQKAQMWTGYAGDAGRQGFDLAKYGQDTFKGSGIREDAMGYVEDKAMDHLLGRKLNLKSDALKFAKGKSKKYLGRGMTQSEVYRRRHPVPGQMYTM